MIQSTKSAPHVQYDNVNTERDDIIIIYPINKIFENHLLHVFWSYVTCFDLTQNL